MDHRRKAVDLAKIIREARMQDPLARYTIDMIKAVLEDLKERLVDADGEDMIRLQGAVRQFKKLHNELTNDPMPINTKENT
jgi:hypothetical protein